MTEESRRSWFTTPRVALIAGALIGFAEITTIASIIFWASQNAVIQIAWYLLGVLFFLVVMILPFAESYGYSKSVNLVKRTSDPQLTWLYLHWGYMVIGVLNVMVILLAYSSIVLTRAPLTQSVETWIAFTGATVLIANVYSFYLLKLIGQAYEGPRGTSSLGVGALARVAQPLLSARKTAGIDYLQESLVMLTKHSQTWAFNASDLDRVLFTIRRLSEVDQPPFENLEALSRSLTELPNLEALPDAFHKFLESQKWSKGFEPHHVKRSSLGSKYVLAFLGSLLTVAVALYPTELRNMAAALGDLIANDPLVLFAFLFSLMAATSSLIMFTYRVGLSDIRNHGDRPLALATLVVGVSWVFWLVAVSIENISLYPVGQLVGGVLLLMVGSLVKHRLERREVSSKEKHAQRVDKLPKK